MLPALSGQQLVPTLSPWTDQCRVQDTEGRYTFRKLLHGVVVMDGEGIVRVGMQFRQRQGRELVWCSLVFRGNVDSPPEKLRIDFAAQMAYTMGTETYLVVKEGRYEHS